MSEVWVFGEEAGDVYALLRIRENRDRRPKHCNQLSSQKRDAIPVPVLMSYRTYRSVRHR